MFFFRGSGAILFHRAWGILSSGKSRYHRSFLTASTSATVKMSAVETPTNSGTMRLFSSVSFAHKHYLEPLSEDEIVSASTAVRTSLGITRDPELQQLRFIAISLKEPTKGTEEIAPRQAEVVTINPQNGLASEHIVDLSTDEVVTSSILPPGTQPMFTPDDCAMAEGIVQNSSYVAQVLKERYDIDDMKRVACDPWSINFVSFAKLNEIQRDIGIPPRLVQAFLYYRQDGDGLEDNHYAHPIDIVPIVELNTRQVISIDGLERQPPPKIPTYSVNYHRNLLQLNSYLPSKWRDETLKALNVVQPDGPSFQVTDGHFVNWQKWSFRVGFNYREGLVLHDVRFDGRSVMHRASLVEMAVPYADPHPPYPRKCAFDVGDYGLGYCANSLELGCDCLGHIHYFDAVLADASGNPYIKKKAICMHEEDQGILWKHVEYRNGYNESRRSRELVISSVATVVNYEYLFYWRLKQDGMIDFEIKLSGELSTNLLSSMEEASGGVPTHGVIVSPGVNAQIHQHMFCMRLDMAVDGSKNTVSEIDVSPQPYDEAMNPYGNAFTPVETTFESESGAVRCADMSKARSWKISNAEGRVNGVNGKPTSYKLLPFTRGPAQPVLLVDPKSIVAKKGAFARANLWVTPYEAEERFPSGEYTPQGDGSVGVHDWTAKNRPLIGEDVVLWHSFGVCHVPRVEDFPVMPVEVTGFTLKPDNFFDGNPAIDLPPETNEASKLAKSCCSV